MRSRAWFLAGMILTLAVPSVRSQSSANTQCPVVSVSSPAEVKEEEPIVFTAATKGGDRTVTPTYNWTVSAGTISSGQGTPTIMVDTQGAGSLTVTATVDIGGYDAKCRTTQQGMTGVAPKASPARKIDQYGAVSLDDQTARLDNYAIALQSEPGTQGYIIAYSGRNSPAGTAAARLRTTKKYLVETRGIDAARLVTINGGPRERSGTELWIVPPGAKPPR